ncbi:MAG: ATP-binding protein [Candidatus Krumholzibacteriota bacterium]|nr:ATP-binding protein [Candidatus Krumholzibacteriota bacterium]
MKELVVISGKGGTGKTSILAAFAALADRCVTADCDVDAADLHLVLDPRVKRTESFSGGVVARIDPARCTGCGRCEELCRFDAVSALGETNAAAAGGGTPGGAAAATRYAIDEIACEGCAVCAYFCPAEAIDLVEETAGDWFVSDARFGPMVHARLRPGGENSGKLVSLVRREARRIADEEGIDMVLVDGSPGIGCPVIASITGADFVLVVTEPTLSGIHDLGRVIELARHFDVPAMVAVNKYDINMDAAAEIEEFASKNGVPVAGRIRYDAAVTAAQIAGRSVVEIGDGPAAEDVRRVWNRVKYVIEQEEH